MHVQSISWHEECYKNSSNHYRGSVERLREELKRAMRERDRNLFYKTQIEYAKKKGKTEFNEERFMKKERDEYYKQVDEKYFGGTPVEIAL